MNRVQMTQEMIILCQIKKDDKKIGKLVLHMEAEQFSRYLVTKAVVFDQIV